MNATEINTGKEFKPVRVDCYSGYKADERPAAFDFQKRRWVVKEILDRWYEGGISAESPIIDYFKVKAGCEGRENIFILQYSAEADAWAMMIRNPVGT